MARKTIKIEIPVKKPDMFSKLLNKILSKHTDLGAASPLTGDPDIDMTEFATLLTEADKKRKQSEDLREQSQKLMEQANNIYGTGKGQTVNTEGTLYYAADLIKMALLKKFRNNEEALSEFGYDVVIGQAKSPTKKPK